MSRPHLADDELDQLARQRADDPSAPADEHLGTCLICSEKLRFLVDYYCMLSVELQKSPYPGLRGIIPPSEGTKKVYHLHYFRASPNLGSLGVVGPGLLLAAQTVKQGPRVPATIATFVSEAGHIVGRITGTPVSGEYELAVVTPGDRSPGRLLVHLSGISPADFPLITGVDGRVELVVQAEINWQKVTIQVSLPMVRFNLEGGLAEGVALVDQEVSLRFSHVQRGYLVTVIGSASARYLAFVLANQDCHVIQIQDGSVGFSAGLAAQTKEILLFS